jgi:hypothetical protein
MALDTLPTPTDLKVCSCAAADVLRDAGLFVPKPSRGAHCQRWGMPDLGTIVRRCPLVFAAGDGRRYSLGYSVPARLEPLQITRLPRDR